MLMRAFTYPHTSEYGRCHFSESRAAMRFRKTVASRPFRPSAETTKGVKWRRAWRQGSRYFFFFSRSCFSRTFEGGRERYELPSVSVTLTSTITSVPLVQNPRTSRSPLSSSCWIGFSLGVVGLAFLSAVVRLELMSGSSRIAELVSAWEQSAPNSSRISLWRRMTRPPFLQERP